MIDAASDPQKKTADSRLYDLKLLMFWTVTSWLPKPGVIGFIVICWWNDDRTDHYKKMEKTGEGILWHRTWSQQLHEYQRIVILLPLVDLAVAEGQTCPWEQAPLIALQKDAPASHACLWNAAWRKIAKTHKGTNVRGMPKGWGAPKQQKNVWHGFKNACPRRVFPFEVPYNQSVLSMFHFLCWSVAITKMDTNGALHVIVSDRT